MYKNANLRKVFLLLFSIKQLPMNNKHTKTTRFFRCLWLMDIKSIRSISYDFFGSKSNGL